MSETNYNLLMAKKMEKIAIAIYLISQFMSDKESLKFFIREKTNELLSKINVLSQTEHLENNFVFYKKALENLIELISFLNVARDTNLISKMNSEIVINSLEVLKNILEKKQFNFNEDFLKIENEEKLNDNFFLNQNLNYQKKISNYNSDLNLDLSQKKEEIKNYSKSNSNIINDNFNKNLKWGQQEEQKSKRQMSIRQNFSKRQTSLSSASSNKKIEKVINKSALIQERKENRKEQILDIFVKNKEYSIKDISKKIPGCSMKTVSRELDNLILENKIKREGERRWARYSLI